MVFHDKPTKKHGERPPAAKSSIIDLPKELLDNILTDGYLPLSDILSARLAHPEFTPICSRFLQNRLRCLYIHPSITNLRTAVEICAHPLFSQGIEKVVLLGRVDWTEIRRFCSTTARHVRNEWDDPDRFRKFCPWPSRYPGISAVSGEEHQASRSHDFTRVADHMQSLTTAHEPLFTALKKLPRLCELSFAEYTLYQGFNKVAQSKIRSVARRSALLPLNGVSARSLMPWADAHLLMGILCNEMLQITHLCLTVEMPYVWPYAQSMREGLSGMPEAISQALTLLKSVELHFDQGWHETKWQLFCRQLLHHAHNLEHIGLVWHSNPTVTAVRCEKTLQGLLGHHTWRALRSIEVRYDVGTEIGRPHRRPLPQQYDFVGFLERHSESLRRIHLQNVIFANFATLIDVSEADDNLEPPTTQLGSRDSAHVTTRKILTFASEMPELDHISLSIIKCRHDARCKVPNGSLNLGQCASKWQCGLYCGPGRYMHADIPRTTVDDLEMLAGELEVELDEERMVWQFGEWVRRKKEVLTDEK